MILQPTMNMALAEPALRVRYTGPFKFACVYIDADTGASDSPRISLGVSNVSLADAVTNKVLAADPGVAGTIQSVMIAIREHRDETLALYVLPGDFKCEVANALLSEAAGAASGAKFSDDAGTTHNYAAGEYGCLKFDNTVPYNGTRYGIRMRVPAAQISKAGVAIQNIGGVPSGQGANAVTREILADDGTVLWSVTGSATSTAAELAFADNDAIPIGYPYPVIVRDSCITTAMSGTTAYVNWMFQEEARRD